MVRKYTTNSKLWVLCSAFSFLFFFFSWESAGKPSGIPLWQFGLAALQGELGASCYFVAITAFLAVPSIILGWVFHGLLQIIIQRCISGSLLKRAPQTTADQP